MYDMPLADCISDQQRNLSTMPQYDTAGGSYAWGPNGHPDIVDGWTYHWDGDSPLFITTNSGALSAVEIEGLASYSPGSTVQFLDRDQSGFVVASHTNGSAGTWYPATPNHEPCGAENLSIEPGPDGIDDGVNVIQGVRNYDPVLQQWSTPDAYQGEVDDPVSQQPYMWNRNNPFSYEDPSGYLSVGDVWNFIAGDDIKTLRSPAASGAEKVLAGADLAMSVVPDAKGLEIVGKGLMKITSYAAGKMAARGITREAVKSAIENGAKFTDKLHAGRITHVLPNGHGQKDLKVITEGSDIVNTMPSRPSAVRNQVQSGRLNPIDENAY
jgi:hypothetical protein